MKILRKLNKTNGACVGLCLLASTLASRSALAEVQLAEKDGWVFSFDGRINAFGSTGWGQDFPIPTLDPNGNTHLVMGGSSPNPGNGIPDVGWPSNVQADGDNNYLGVRVRSGFFSNILGFGISKRVSETTMLRGYASFWATIETRGRDKWAPIIAEAREGYLDATGTWGTLTVGRTIGWLGRTSWDIDRLYGHGYGLGLPCTDTLGPACGHIGTGVLFPGYSAGLAYSTPSFSGITAHLGLYDPVAFSANDSDWSRAAMVRPEGALRANLAFGSVRFIAGVEGAYQGLSRIDTQTDPNDPTITVKRTLTTSIWGVSGGGRLEIGPLRVGGSYFHGRGIGIGYALQSNAATEDNESSHPQGAMSPPPTYALRMFSGYYGQGALVFGQLQLGGGYGRAWADRLAVDRQNPALSALRYQQGISASVYYRLSDAVVLGLDYFNYLALWYGAPQADPGTSNLTGQRLRGERQQLNFVNVGVTYHW